MRLKLLILLVISLMVPNLVMAEIMTVTFSGTEMRSLPKAMASKVIIELAPNTPLKVLEKGAEYYKVNDYRGRTGWVHKSLLGTTSGAIIVGTRANVRQGPSKNDSVIFQLTQGDTCRVLAKEEGWLEIKTADGRKGWIAAFLTWGQ